MSSRTPADAERWMQQGTKLFDAVLSGLDDDELTGPTALAGWTGRHLVAHVAANADALSNLVHWAASGQETPMYASMAQRDADIEAGARRDLYAHMDAANVDLKAFTEDFYHRVCSAHLADVLDTLVYLRHETDVWFEITTLLIPGRNDSDAEIAAETAWIVAELGPDVPLHFTAFHPDYKMRDVPATPAATLSRARRIALEAGLRYVYTGNVHDAEGGTTRCPGCGDAVVVRDWHVIRRYALDGSGRCGRCGTQLPGVYDGAAGHWGRRRLPVLLTPHRR